MSTALLNNNDFVMRLRIRLEDAARERRDLVGAVLDSMREHQAQQAPAVYKVFSATKSIQIRRGAENTYYITLQPDGHDEASIRLEQEEFSNPNPNAFIAKYLQNFHDLLTFQKGEWNELRQSWLTSPNLTILEGVEEVSDEILDFELVIDRIRRCKLTDVFEYSLRNDDWLYYKASEGDAKASVVIRADRLGMFLRSTGSTITAKRLATLLREHGYADKGSFSQKVSLEKSQNRERRTSLRFWALSAELLDFTEADILPIPNEDTAIPPVPAGGENETPT